MLRGFTVYRPGEAPERGEAEFNGSMARFLATAIAPILGDAVGFEELVGTDGAKIRALFGNTAGERQLPANDHEQDLRGDDPRGIRGTIIVLDEA